MNKYSPYWILNPLKNDDVNIKPYKNWSFYTFKEIIDGKSPLESLGNTFYLNAHETVSLCDSCLWIFNDTEYNDSTDYSRLAWVLKQVSESFCNSLLSQTGIIVKYGNGDIIKHPVFPKHYESIVVNKITNEILIRIINITESIYQKDSMEYLNIFEYLSKIKKSSTYIRELALWSFIEQHWAVDDSRKLDKSLKKLGLYIYNNNRKNPAYLKFKSDLKELITSISGKKNNLTEMRNALAHGAFFKQKNEWTEKQQNLFFTVHNDLFEMVLMGLEKEILT